MSARPSILLLRESTESDPYITAFADFGFEASCFPVLDFEPVGRARLADHLASPDSFSGLVLTSHRAADALAGFDLAGWSDKQAYVVGPRTAAYLRRLGWEPHGEKTGSADALAGLVAAEPFAKPLLFLCGDRRRNELPDRLRTAGIPFEEVVVYRTKGDASAVRQALLNRPDWVAFFSPSGVDAVRELDGISWNSLACAAIGPTTAEALYETGLVPVAVADTPTPAALAAAVSSACRSLDA